MRISFLTPRLPPQVCGLADHTQHLALALSREGVEVGFIHRQAGQSTFDLPAGPVDYWDDSARSLEACVRRQAPDWLWVQLSGYGYSRWGAPYRLAQGLKALAKNLPQLRRAVFLHEPHCDARQLGLKGLFLSPWQKHTVGQVVRSADVVFTSNELWRRRILTYYHPQADRLVLLRLGAHVPCVRLTPTERIRWRQELGWNEADVVAVTFGSVSMQRTALERLAPLLAEGLSCGALDRIVCVGGDLETAREALAPWQSAVGHGEAFQVLGYRPAAEVGAILASCDFAFLGTPRPLLEKSTAFVAAAEAGLAVLAPMEADVPAVPDTLPVIAAERWDWRQARSPQVSELRSKLRRHAEEHHSWETIARRALAVLQARTSQATPSVPAVTAPLDQPIAP
jgi:glycosyltransferase involved in cell wall biosynthesis